MNKVFFSCLNSFFVVVTLMYSAANLAARELKVPGDGKSIQNAIDSAQKGDTIRVGKGIYIERLKLKSGVNVFGSGPEFTKIRGDGKGDIIIGNDDCTISGFTIEKSGNEYFAIRCNSTSPIIKENIVLNNGGGIYLADSKAQLEQNLIVGTDDGSDFGSIAVFCQGGNPIIKNNTIVNNHVRFGIICDNSAPIIKFNIIVFNLGGIGCFNSSKPELSDNNVWNNNVIGNYQDCKPDTNSISEDPLFIDTSKGDYRLSTQSPCLREKGNIGAVGYRIIIQE